MKLKLKKKRNKFLAIKTEFAGLLFDSAKEAQRWGELLILERIGEINCLQRQVPFVLVPGVKITGEKRARPAVRLFVDFTYRQKGVQIVEDVKSPITAKLAAFRMKQHLLAAVHGLEIRLTGS